MPVRILLAHTPPRDQRPPMHAIHSDGAVYNTGLFYDGTKHGELRIDPHSLTVYLGHPIDDAAASGDENSSQPSNEIYEAGYEHKFRAGMGMQVTEHLHRRKLHIDYRGRRVTLSLTCPHRYAELLGQLTLFSWSPPGFCLLAPLAAGAVSAVFTAYSAATGTTVAIRHVRACDLRHAHADDVVDRAAAVLKQIPDCPRNGVLRPTQAFWHRNVFYAVTPLCTPLSQLLSSKFSSSHEEQEITEQDASQDDVYDKVRSIMRDLLTALAHLHSHGIVHGHVTREHVLLTGDGRVRLTGFGHAISIRRSSTDTYRRDSFSSSSSSSSSLSSLFDDASSTAGDDELPTKPLRRGLYAKRVGRDAVPPGGRRPSKAADVWAAGVILYALLHSGNMSGLHNNDVRAGMIRSANRNAFGASGAKDAELGETTFPLVGADIPTEFVSLLRGLLQPSPKKRLSARAALEHCALQTETFEDVADEEEDSYSTAAAISDSRCTDEESEEEDGSGDGDLCEKEYVSMQARMRFQAAVSKVANMASLVYTLRQCASMTTNRQAKDKMVRPLPPVVSMSDKYR